jgi:hypothetical protein
MMRSISRTVWSAKLTRILLTFSVVAAGVYVSFILQIHSRAARAFSARLRPVRLETAGHRSMVYLFLHSKHASNIFKSV